MKRIVAGLAAVWLGAAMPALAQNQPQIELTEAQQDEIYCVYEYLDLFADREKLATAYMSGETKSADFQEQIGLVDEGGKSCGEEFKWNDDQQATVSMLGLYAFLGDVLDDRLQAKNLTEKNLDVVYSAASALSREDKDAFVNGKWFDDKALQGRLTTALGDGGIRGDAVLTDAFYLTEAFTITTAMMQEWVRGLKKG
ncbi:MAG: hypothetical protein EON93_13765 [Burkholderiales bacterium]|nr:MAG: hypothetical protein EON93_13765 [Burkholderiales bacterium]